MGRKGNSLLSRFICATYISMRDLLISALQSHICELKSIKGGMYVSGKDVETTNAYNDIVSKLEKCEELIERLR